MRRTVFGILLMLLLTALFLLSFSFKPAKGEWTGTVYIRADGSIYPSDAPIITQDDVTYTLIGNITSTVDAIVVERDNVIIDGNGYAINGSRTQYRSGVKIYGRYNVTLKNLNVQNFWFGVFLGNSYNCTISGCNIKANVFGILLDAAFNNTISRNDVKLNTGDGFRIIGCGYNIINGNNVSGNFIGMEIYISYDNTIYHNNIINNAEQVYIYNSINTWDDGYPSGGNYWSDYNGVDLYSGPFQNETGCDGIGDAPYVYGSLNKDRYPLMAPFCTFDAGTWNGVACNIDIVTNSTISNFQLGIVNKTVSFSVAGENGTTGFCRIIIPNVIVQELWQGNYTVLLNGEPWLFKNWTAPENTYIYINYTHSEYEIAIVTEFPSTIILLMLILTTLATAILFKEKRKRQKPSFLSGKVHSFLPLTFTAAHCCTFPWVCGSGCFCLC